MRHYIRRALRLSPSELVLLTRAFATLVLVDIGLRLGGFAHVMGWISRRPASHKTGDDALRRAGHYAHWIDVAADHHLIRARCLHRSLTLHSWLRDEGWPSELRIGVRRQGSELTAHAWIELDGQAVNEQPERVAAFRPLVGLNRIPHWSAINGTVGDGR